MRCPLSQQEITDPVYVKTREDDKDITTIYQAEAIFEYLASMRLRIDPINGQTIISMDTTATQYREKMTECMDLPVPSSRHTVQYNASIPSASSRVEPPTSFRTLANVGGALVRSPSEISLVGNDQPLNFNELGGSRVSSRQSNGSGGSMQ